MNERIKTLRKHLNLTQKDFAKKLGMVASTITKIEKGNATLTDKNIQLIVNQFNINENWLRTGEGEMFVEVSFEEEVAYILGKSLNSENKFMLNTLKALAELQEEEWDVVSKFVENFNSKDLEVLGKVIDKMKFKE